MQLRGSEKSFTVKPNYQAQLISLSQHNFFSRLSHSHIVNLHGTGCAEPGSANFYIIIEQVQSTLSDAITVFRRQRERLKLVNIYRNGVRLDKKGKAAELRNDFNRRVDIARQLASALQYLHENS